MRTSILAGLLMCLLLVGSTCAGAVSTGTLYDLGYSYQHSIAYDNSMPWTDFNGSYSHTTNGSLIIGQVNMWVPYNRADSIIYFNLQLTDGTKHKGSYECLGQDSYRIYLDGTGYTGTYNYSLMDRMIQMLGQYQHNYLVIVYACSLEDKSKTALYIQTQTGDGVHIDPKATVLLLPLTATSTGIKAFSAASNYQVTVQCCDVTTSELLGIVQGESGVPAAWTGNETSTGLTYYLGLIEQFINPLISIGTALLQVILLVFMIGRFLIDPLNLVLTIILFEEFAAIIALSTPGDIFKSMGRFAAFNERLFNFIIMMANGMIQFISIMIQSLGIAVQAAAQMAQAGAAALGGVVSWLGTLLAILPK